MIFLNYLKKIVPSFENEIALLVLSGYQFGFLPIDKTINLTGMITLLDTRSQSIMIDFENKFSTEKSIKKQDVHLHLTILYNESYGLKRKNRKFLETYTRYWILKVFFIYNLTGQFISEPSIASTTQLLDIKTQDWDDELIAQVGIKKEQLPRLLPGNAIADLIKKRSC